MRVVANAQSLWGLDLSSHIHKSSNNTGAMSPSSSRLVSEYPFSGRIWDLFEKATFKAFYSSIHSMPCDAAGKKQLGLTTNFKTTHTHTKQTTKATIILTIIITTTTTTQQQQQQQQTNKGNTKHHFDFI